MDIRAKQSLNIAAITFWSQLAVYTFNSILILYLTKSAMDYGLGYNEKQAYAFQGVSNAMSYAFIAVGGYVADKYIGIRRSILIGSLLLAVAFGLLFLSGFTVGHTDTFFVAAYALVPICGSILLGTSSGMVSKIYSDDNLRAKGAMTIYYLSINAGSIIAYLLGPWLIDYRYGPLAILGIVALGKIISASNFAWRYNLYDNVVDQIDKKPMMSRSKLLVISYFIIGYIFTFISYNYPSSASVVVGIFCLLCALVFLVYTFKTLQGIALKKQLCGLILTMVALAFFVVYNQENSTLVLCAKNNSSLTMFGIPVGAAAYQFVNPVVIILGGLLLSYIYKRLPKFNIPTQFTIGMFLAGAGLLITWYAFYTSSTGIINGNYLVFTYIVVSISELFISAIGLSMIGLYCDLRTIGFAMGVWYIVCALSNVITGLLNQVVALPTGHEDVTLGWHLYQHYFGIMGLSIIIFSVFTGLISAFVIKWLKHNNVAAP